MGKRKGQQPRRTAKFQSPPEDSVRTSFHRDTALSFPPLYMEVYIAGDAIEQRAFADMFIRTGSKRATSPEEADLVVFTGGADVDPLLYGAEKNKKTYCDPVRDKADMVLYQKCLELGIPMFGVCRGAQFLHVMNGGELYQDVDNHHGDHALHLTKENRVLQSISSVHHQMCKENELGGMEVLGYIYKSSTRHFGASGVFSGTHRDIEAFWYPKTGCFGVQGHPEYKGYYAFAQWCLSQLNKLFLENPDYDLIDNLRRMKPEILAARLAERKKGLVELAKEIS